MRFNFDLGFTKEEKILSLVPTIYALIDHIATFLGAKQLTVLYVEEMNSGFVNIVSQHGALGLFLWLIWIQCILFLTFIVIISIIKHYNLDTKYIYALVFFYGGYRIDGALSWFVL